MGIQLEWEVESDLGREAVEEDAQIVAAQKRRSRRVWFAFLALVICLGVMAATGYSRARLIADERLKALYATVEAESLALRLGDKHKFMQMQGSAERWRATQRQHFDEIQALGMGVNVTGEILDLHYMQDEAEVWVEIIVDGIPLQGVWLYEYTDKGWKHVATQQNPWVKETVVTGPFIFTYNSLQRPDVNQLSTLLRGWWADASTATGITDQPTLKVVIDLDAEKVAWANGGQDKLLIPSQVLAQASLDDPNDPLRVQLAILFAAQWADYILPTRLTNSDLEVWAKWQFGLAMQSTFGLPRDPQLALDLLIPAFGPEVLSDFASTSHMTGDGLMALDQAVISNAPYQVDATYFESLLEFLIVANAYEAGLNFNASNASLMFIDAGDDRWAADFVMSDWLMGAKPGTLRVQKTERLGNLYWVTVRFEYNPFWYDSTHQAEISTVQRQLSFRKVGRLWKISVPRIGDLGYLIEYGEHITFMYPSIDQEYYGDLLPTLEEVYMQAAADFGVGEPPAIEVGITYDDHFGLDFTPEVIHPTLASPRMMNIPIKMSVDDLVRDNAIETIYFEMFEYVAGAYAINRNTSPMEYSLRRLALRQHGWDRSDDEWMASVKPQPDIPLPDDWDALWQPHYYTDEEENAYYWTLMQIGSDTLLKTMLEFGGEEAFHRMVQTVRRAPTIDIWVHSILFDKGYDDLTLKYIEEVWLGRFYEEVRRVFGDEPFE
jgi:hypothetical protein